MTEVDELLSRLRKLGPIAPPSELQGPLRARAQRRLFGGVRPAPFASLAVFGTVIAYLSWAVHFACALYP